MVANSIYYIEYEFSFNFLDSSNRPTGSQRTTTLKDRIAESDEDQIGPSMRYIWDQRRLMPWQLANPLFQSMRIPDISAYSLMFLSPSTELLDLTMNNGFCPSFHKKGVVCSDKGSLHVLTNGDAIKTCSASAERVNCCTEAGHRPASKTSTDLNGDQAVGFGDKMDFELDVMVY